MNQLKRHLLITGVIAAASVFAGAEDKSRGTRAPTTTSNAKLSMGAFINGLSKWDQLGKTPLRKQMEHISLRKVKLNKTPLDVALKSIRQDIADSGGPKINFFIKAPNKNRKALVTMELNNMPLLDVLRYMCMRSGLVYKVDEHAVVFTPAPPGTKY